MSPDLVSHPRLLITDLAELRDRASANSVAAALYAKVKADADAILSLPVAKYSIPDGLRLLETSREVVRRTYSLAFAWAVEQDPVYSTRLWNELQAVASFPDWNHARHSLDAGEMTHAVAIGYDWLYETWTESQRATLRAAIREHGLKPALTAYDTVSSFPLDWPRLSNNWNIVCNSGMTLGALAIADQEPALSAGIIERAAASIPLAIEEYAPGGAYPEGMTYWNYATKYLVTYIASLVSATGDDRGFIESPGLAETGYFPIYLGGPSGEAFNYYDGFLRLTRPSEMLWLATTFGQPVFGWWGLQGAQAETVSWNQSPMSVAWYEPDAVASPIETRLPLDRHFVRAEVVSIRSGWEDPSAMFTGFKAGDNATSHGDNDLGDFVFDSMGVRWASDLGVDDYNVPGYFDRGPEGQRWTYYRKRAEGQNTVVVNPSKSAGQLVPAVGAIIKKKFRAKAAFAIADLSQANAGLSSWRRGVLQFDDRQQLIVQDEFELIEPGEAWWFMHTTATINVAGDGRSAVLQKDGRQVLARIASPDGATFLNAEAKPLWTSPDPVEQQDVLGMRKLAIRLENTSGARLTVQFTPVREGVKTPKLKRARAMDSWDAGPESTAELASLAVDGVEVPAFSPENRFYSVELPDNVTRPAVSARPASRSGSVTVGRFGSLPGVVEVTVRQGNREPGRYRLHLTRPAVIDGPVAFPYPVIASADDGNVPANTVDGDLATRWSAEGDQWIAYDLGSDGPVAEVAIAWFNGDKRTTKFEIDVATSGEHEWRRVFEGTSSGTSADLETYAFAELTARYVRIVGHGNSVNRFNSISEVVIAGRTVTLPESNVFLASVASGAPAALAIGASVQLVATGTLSDGSAAELDAASVAFATDDPAIATVTPEGELTGVAAGDVSVSAIVITPSDHRLVYDRRIVSVADARTVTFSAAGDAWVNDGANANVNYGTSSTLIVKADPSVGKGYNRQSFVRFEPSDLTGEIQSIALVFSARTNDSTGTDIDIDVRRVEGEFDEALVTWNTKPAIGDSIATFPVTSTITQAVVDVTDALRDAVRAGEPVSVALVQTLGPGQAGLSTVIWSRESATPPVMRVTLA
ncbi:DNRLRE domain-containing protein [Microbacterium invictum]|uniref:DNRLRE domain-containing protein n=1 Tax=Microbacterium invictum TaxID=515415 RepID=A0ABZ0VC41_9MICO|nr:DNRLRE domain-containing protein [Microbacterium invictum]WQB70699.1 DNRLRE domain-containing protein [Microbacterium invictum]